MTGSEPQHTPQEVALLDHLPQYASTPWFARLFFAVNLVVFLVMVIGGGVSPFEASLDELFVWGADYGPTTTYGERWRHLTSAFVHIGFVHLGVNLWWLWRAGELCERLLGNAAFLILYLFCAVGSSLVSITLAPYATSAGASGALFGVIGALAVLVARHRHALPPGALKRWKIHAVLFVVATLAMGLTLPGIDNAAHLGGLVFGVLCGLLLDPSRELPLLPARLRYARTTLLVVPLAVLVWVSVASSWPGANPLSLRHYQVAWRANVRADWSQVVRASTSAIEVSPGFAGAYAMRGDAHMELGNDERAQEDLDRARELAPDDWRVTADAAYAEGWLAWRAGETGRSLAAFDTALEADPDRPEFWHSRGLLQLELGAKLHFAIADFGRAIQLNPEWSPPYRGRGDAYLAAGRLADARLDYSRAERLEELEAAGR